MDKTRSFGLPLLAGAVLGFLAALGTVFFLVGWDGFRGKQSLAPTRMMLTKIQTLSELVTVKYLVEKVVKLEAEPSVLGRDRIVLLTHAVVKAGVDLSNLKPEDVEVSGTKLTLTLPPARITDCYLDEKKTEVWEHTTAFWRTFDAKLEQNARRQALDEIRLAAGEQGIQKEAIERAQFQLTAFLRSLGYTEVEIKSQ
ncbi:MAG: DUF4230 domain-containing protein [Verrucomicrobiales bacterium]|nr:DUF4230 domain-containing protein [Verrucomicrobiales bacterium]